jgi:hypothetical protein
MEKLETQLASYKKDQVDGEGARVTSEALTRKVQLLEEELDTAEKNVKDTVEKYDAFSILLYDIYIDRHTDYARLT